MHARFHVSVKAAIYSPDRQTVLVIHMPGKLGYGLPGGHIEKREQPDAAMARELYEEVGLKNVPLRRIDFFIHGNGKIILAYAGVADPSARLGSTQAISEGDAVWLTRSEFESVPIDPGYRKFVLKNW